MTVGSAFEWTIILMVFIVPAALLVRFSPSLLGRILGWISLVPILLLLAVIWMFEAFRH